MLNIKARKAICTSTTVAMLVLSFALLFENYPHKPSLNTTVFSAVLLMCGMYLTQRIYNRFYKKY